MDFRTELKIRPSDFSFDYRSEVVSIGSCFADVIGLELDRNKFKVTYNAFGIIYNPIALWESIFRDKFPEECIVERDGIWYSLLFHSEVFGRSADELRHEIASRQATFQKKLKTTSHLIVTLGTAWVYELKSLGMVVANCQKRPMPLFNKRLLSVEEIVSSFGLFYQKLIAINPSIHIIFTVSPVRHIKDTLPLNAVSKSVLRLAIHELQNLHSGTSYFPSYELLLDDLRDYRYYAEDMLHPSKQAEKYIIEKFYETYLDADALPILKNVRSIVSGLEHRPFQEYTEGHQIFLKELLAKAKLVSKHVNVEMEIAMLTQKIIS